MLELDLEYLAYCKSFFFIKKKKTLFVRFYLACLIFQGDTIFVQFVIYTVLLLLCILYTHNIQSVYKLTHEDIILRQDNLAMFQVKIKSSRIKSDKQERYFFQDDNV